MEDFKLLKKALDKAIQKGAYTFDEAAVIINAYQTVEHSIEKMKVQIKVLEDENNKNSLKKQPRKGN